MWGLLLQKFPFSIYPNLVNRNFFARFVEFPVLKKQQFLSNILSVWWLIEDVFLFFILLKIQKSVIFNLQVSLCTYVLFSKFGGKGFSDEALAQGMGDGG